MLRSVIASIGVIVVRGDTTDKECCNAGALMLKDIGFAPHPLHLENNVSVTIHVEETYHCVDVVKPKVEEWMSYIAAVDEDMDALVQSLASLTLEELEDKQVSLRDMAELARKCHMEAESQLLQIAERDSMAEQLSSFLNHSDAQYAYTYETYRRHPCYWWKWWLRTREEVTYYYPYVPENVNMQPIEALLDLSTPYEEHTFVQEYANCPTERAAVKLEWEKIDTFRECTDEVTKYQHRLEEMGLKKLAIELFGWYRPNYEKLRQLSYNAPDAKYFREKVDAIFDKSVMGESWLSMINCWWIEEEECPETWQWVEYEFRGLDVLADQLSEAPKTEEGLLDMWSSIPPLLEELSLSKGEKMRDLLKFILHDRMKNGNARYLDGQMKIAYDAQCSYLSDREPHLDTLKCADETRNRLGVTCETDYWGTWCWDRTQNWASSWDWYGDEHSWRTYDWFPTYWWNDYFCWEADEWCNSNKGEYIQRDLMNEVNGMFHQLAMTLAQVEIAHYYWEILYGFRKDINLGDELRKVNGSIVSGDTLKLRDWDFFLGMDLSFATVAPEDREDSELSFLYTWRNCDANLKRIRDTTKKIVEKSNLVDNSNLQFLEPEIPIGQNPPLQRWFAQARLRVQRYCEVELLKETVDTMCLRSTVNTSLVYPPNVTGLVFDDVDSQEEAALYAARAASCVCPEIEEEEVLTQSSSCGEVNNVLMDTRDSMWVARLTQKYEWTALSLEHGNSWKASLLAIKWAMASWFESGFLDIFMVGIDLVDVTSTGSDNTTQVYNTMVTFDVLLTETQKDSLDGGNGIDFSRWTNVDLSSHVYEYVFSLLNVEWNDVSSDVHPKLQKISPVIGEDGKETAEWKALNQGVSSSRLLKKIVADANLWTTKRTLMQCADCLCPLTNLYLILYLLVGIGIGFGPAVFVGLQSMRKPQAKRGTYITKQSVYNGTPLNGELRPSEFRQSANRPSEFRQSANRPSEFRRPSANY